MATWQSNGISVSYLYDGVGNRVEQQRASGSTSTSAYKGDVAEAASSGTTTDTAAYSYAGSQRIALAVNGVLSYLACDGLGSADVHAAPTIDSAYTTASDAADSMSVPPLDPWRLSRATLSIEGFGPSSWLLCVAPRNRLANDRASET